MKTLAHKQLSVFSLSMINFALLGSLNFWSYLAGHGYFATVIFPIALLAYFIPLLFTYSELFSGWPTTGGIYTWVKEAFGRRAGFVSMWILWLQTIFWIPLPLIWISKSIARACFPFLLMNPIYQWIFSLTLLWITTLVLYRGIRVIKAITTICVIFGYFIPGIVIIFLGVLWNFIKPVPPDPFSLQELSQQLSNPQNWTFLIAILYMILGIEISALHMEDVKTPKRTFPKAIFISGGIFALMSILGGLSLSSISPKYTQEFFSGTYHNISKLLDGYHLNFLIPLFSILIGIGIFATVFNWLAGPVRGLLSVAKDGDLPPAFRNMTKHNMPKTLLNTQAIIISILCTIYILIPNINQIYWVLIWLTTTLFLLLHVLFFSSVIRLRYKKPQLERPFKIPGKKFGLWLIAGFAAIASIIAFFIGFIAPFNTVTISSLTFFLIISMGTLLFCLAPWFILLFKKPHWNVLKKPKDEKPI